MSRAYMRLDPHLFERKAIEQDYAASELVAYVGALCLADAQPNRGRFRDEKLLKALLGKYGKHVPDLIRRGDLVVQSDGRVYVDGWDEWQEGDLTVRERVARLRARRHKPTVTSSVTTRVVTDRTATYNNYVDEVVTGRSNDVTIPPPPAERGRRNDGTNPRAVGEAPRQTGDNTRATGTSTRQERERLKTTPMNVGAILAGMAARAAGGDE